MTDALFGLSTTGMRGLPLERAIALAAGLNLPAVEFLASREAEDYGVPGIWPWETAPVQTLRPLLRNFRQVSLQAPFSNLEFFSLNPRVRRLAVDHVLETLDLAGKLGAKLVTIVFNRGRNQLADEWKEQEAVSLLREFGAYGAERGVRIAVENTEHFYPLERLLKTIDEVDSPNVGITLDIGHVFLSKEIPYYEPFAGAADFIRAAGGRIFSIHVHDYDGKVDHLPVGEGRIRWEPIIEAIGDVQYRGSIIFESVFTQPEDIMSSLRYFSRRWQEIVKPPSVPYDLPTGEAAATIDGMAGLRVVPPPGGRRRPRSGGY